MRTNESIDEEEAYIILSYKQLLENTVNLTYFPSELLFGNLMESVLKRAGFKSLNSLASYLGFSGVTVLVMGGTMYAITDESTIKNKINDDQRITSIY